MPLDRLNRRNFFSVAAVAWFVAALPITAAASAQQAQPNPEAYFVSATKPGMHLQSFIHAVRQQFRASDIDMDGTVSQTDKRIQDEGSPRAVWTPALHELLRYDLDFDGTITHAEVVKGVSDRIRRNAYVFPSGDNAEESLHRRIQQDVARLMRADRNGDGVIEWQEMLAFARQTPVPPNSVGGGFMSMVLSMDEDGDGTVTLTEFDRAIERIFRSVDTDGDGILSKDELDSFRARK
jgi:Ca2+-binding EF-hand superfamily protein